MRILYHHRTQAADAQGVHIEEIIRAFRQLGHEVHESALVKRQNARLPDASTRIYGVAAAAFRRLGYEVLECAYSPIGYRMLAAAAASFKPDFIYERYSLHNFAGLWTSRRFGIPLVLEVNSPMAEERKRYEHLLSYRGALRSERAICSGASVTIAVTNVLKKMLVSNGVPAEKIVVMHNGVNRRRFNPEVSGEEIRRRYGIQDRVVLGFVGWFRAWHGLESMIEAFIGEKLWEKGAHLLLVGNGSESSSLRKLAEAARVLQHVTFAGPAPRQDVPKLIAAMDVAMQPAVTPYACPMKLIEYMAMGKAVIAPDLENIRELVTDGETALLFADGDYGQMLSAARRLISEVPLRLQLGRAAACSVEERNMFWEENARRVCRLVSKMRNRAAQAERVPA